MSKSPYREPVDPAEAAAEHVTKVQTSRFRWYAIAAIICVCTPVIFFGESKRPKVYQPPPPAASCSECFEHQIQGTGGCGPDTLLCEHGGHITTLSSTSHSDGCNGVTPEAKVMVCLCPGNDLDGGSQ